MLLFYIKEALINIYSFFSLRKKIIFLPKTNMCWLLLDIAQPDSNLSIIFLIMLTAVFKDES